MSDQIIKSISQAQLKTDLPVLKTGQTVRVHQKVKEGEKERIQIFEGVVLGINGGTGINATLRVRKVSEGIGVERIFPIHSPLVEKIEIVKTSRVRQSKLYYIRDKQVKMKEDKERHQKHLNRVKLREDELAKEAAAKAKAEVEAKAKSEKAVPEEETKSVEKKSEDKKESGSEKKKIDAPQK
jgi:large subunit ribosomal protein L19